MIVVLVGGAYAALAFSNGGYSTQLIAVVTVAIWWLVIVGLATRLLPGAAVQRPAVSAGVCLAGLAGLTALSMIWANDAGRAFVELVRVAGYLGLFVLVVMGSARGGARPWLLGLVLGLTVVVVGALASRFDPSLFGGADRAFLAQLPLSNGRLSYPLGYWNGLGACVAIGMTLLAWLGSQGESRLERAAATGLLAAFGLTLYLSSSRGGFVATTVGAIALVVLMRRRGELLGTILLGGAGAAVLSLLASQRGDLVHALTTSTAYSQGRVMALATVVCVVVVALVRYLLDRPLSRVELPRVSPAAVLAAVVLAAVIVLLALGPSDTVHQFADTHDIAGTARGHLTSLRGTGRYQFWQAALDAFESKPVLGVGAGNYDLWWNVHGSIAVVTLDAHSLYLETLAELGVVGLLVLLAFLVVVAASGLRRVLRPAFGANPDGPVLAALAVFAAGLSTAAFDWTWELPAAFAPVIVAAALLTGGATSPVPDPDEAARSRPTDGARRSPGPRRRSQFGLGVATILCAWVAIWVAGDQIIATVKLDDSHNAVDSGRLEDAAKDARDAAAIQPWSTEPQLQLAQVEQRIGDLPAAREAAAKAIEHASGDWRTWLVAAEVAAASGDRDTAKSDLARAAELSPTRLPVVLGS